MLAALGMLSCGGVLVAEFSIVNREIAGLKSELSALRGKLAKMEDKPAAVLRRGNERNDGVTGSLLANAGDSPQEPLVLSRDDIQLIRDFIKVAPPPAGAARRINVGDLLPDTALTAVPEPIMDKLPKLRGARFTIDRNSAIIIVAPGTNRVDVIINPS